MMMHQRKSVRYKVSGVQFAAGQRMNVRSNVTLPDAEAGMAWEEDREPFRVSESAQIAQKRSYDVPVHIAALILCALFVLFGIAIIGKMIEKSQISKNITAMKSNIDLTNEENALLALEVAAARDKEHITYMATESLGMVKSNTAEAVPVIAPETRPHQAAQTTQTNAWDSMISGSR